MSARPVIHVMNPTVTFKMTMPATEANEVLHTLQLTITQSHSIDMTLQENPQFLHLMREVYDKTRPIFHRLTDQTDFCVNLRDDFSFTINWWGEPIHCKDIPQFLDQIDTFVVSGIEKLN